MNSNINEFIFTMNMKVLAGEYLDKCHQEVPSQLACHLCDIVTKPQQCEIPLRQIACYFEKGTCTMFCFRPKRYAMRLRCTLTNITQGPSPVCKTAALARTRANSIPCKSRKRTQTCHASLTFSQSQINTKCVKSVNLQ